MITWSCTDLIEGTHILLVDKEWCCDRRRMSLKKILIFACWLASCQANKRFQQVRLVGGTGSHEGTVEYASANSKDMQYAGAICDDFWDILDAHVVCRMLGFPRGADVAWKYSHFGSSPKPIIYDDVTCEGNEEGIEECSTSGEWEHDCSEFEHAGVTCNRVSRIAGLFKVYHNNTWSIVAVEKEESWGAAESKVFCRSIDSMFVRDTRFDEDISSEEYLPGISFVSISCNGDEVDLMQCEFSSFGKDTVGENVNSQLTMVITCLEAKLQGGRASNEGLLIISDSILSDHHDYWATVMGTISEEGARALCMEMGFADIADILKDNTFSRPKNVFEVNITCEDEALGWWECGNILVVSVIADGSNGDSMGDTGVPISLVCRPYYAIASETSFDHWTMDMVIDPSPSPSLGIFQRPSIPSNIPSIPSLTTTTTTTASPSSGRAMRSTPTTPKGCTLKGSYESEMFDDIRLSVCDVIIDERGPVGHAILGVSAASIFLEFPGMTSYMQESNRVFCAGDVCPNGFAFAYWFTLPACTKPRVGVSIRSGMQTCFLLEAHTRIRLKANKDNDDGQITMTSTDCSSTDATAQNCSPETLRLFSRSFTTTPFETEMYSENGCGYRIWNHVALNVHQSESPMTCELYINGKSDKFSCEPLASCLSSVRYGLSLDLELGPDTGLDEVGLWRRPLEESEVTSLYHQPTDMPENFTDIPLWVVPSKDKTNNCPCEETTEMDIVDQIKNGDAVTPNDLIQISEQLTTIINVSDFTQHSDRIEKHKAIQSSLDVISSLATLSAKKAKESMENTNEFHQVGHNILSSVEALQNALLNDVTIFNKFRSDEIEITTAPAAMGTDFVYRRDVDDETTVRISSKNFKQGSRISVALLKGSAASFLPKTLTQNNKSVVRSDVTSPVLNVQTTGVDVESLKENITFTIPHIKDTMKPKNASFVCSFYEPDRKSFSNHGCIRVSRGSNDQSTTCSCNHMTSFAILMAVTDVSISRANEFALDVITYIGCGLSIVALIFSLIVLGVSKLKSVRIRILINQCVAMLLAQTLFISLVENASSNQVACKVVAAFLHLLFLSVIFWMFVQGAYMYSKTTMLQRAVIPLKYFLLIGWGVPVVIVGVTAAININFYGMEDICWLNRDTGGIWVFVVPAIVIALMNTVIMGLTVKALRSIKVFQNKSDKDKVKSTLKAMFVILPILGVTWITGILVNVSAIFSYLFAISNAFQGLFLFIMQILINGEIRSALRLRKSRILPFNTSSIGDSAAMGNKSSRSHEVTRSTMNTTRTGVGVHSISGNGPSVVGDALPAAQ